MATGENEVQFEDATYRVIKEGSAKLLGPASAKSPDPDVNGDGRDSKDKQTQSVFYNPIQQFNRDLSVLAIRVFADDLEAIRRQKTSARRPRRFKQSHPHQEPNADAATEKLQKASKSCSEGETVGAQQNGVVVHQVEKASDAMVSNGSARVQQMSDEVAISDQHQHLGEATRSDKRKRDPDEVASAAEEPPSKVLRPDSYAIREPDATESRRRDNDSQREVSKGDRESANALNNVIADGTSSTNKYLWSEEEPAGHCSHAKSPTPNKIPLGPTGSEATEPSPLFQFRILDALSATGLRALRYASELPQVTSVTANDVSPSAIKTIALNTRFNKLESKIIITMADANAQMRNARLKYEVIDLDPYGTATPFIDDAVRSLTNGGLLCITCTDSGVFASCGYSEKTFSQYGGMTIKGPYSHESGLRLLLQATATSAARYGLATEPLLSLSIDFYIRVFVKIYRSPQDVKFLASKSMLVYSCDSGCGAWTVQYMGRTKMKEDKKGNPVTSFSLPQAPTASPHCEHCGFKTHLAGPMWGGPIQNPMFIQRMLDVLPDLSKDVYETMPRMQGMLMTARDETLMADESQIIPAKASKSAQDGTPPYPLPKMPAHEIDHHPFYFFPSMLASVLRTTAPSANAMRGALIGLGYRVTRSHTKAGSIRTDAPWSVIWEVMREWVRRKAPFKEGSIRPGTAGWGIMGNERSMPSVDRVKADLEEVPKTSETVGEIKTKLEALLWRLDRHARREQEPDPKPADKGDSSHHGDPTQHNQVSDAPLWQVKVEFNEALGQASEEKTKLVRYQQNPRANWGPMTRAKG